METSKSTNETGEERSGLDEVHRAPDVSLRHRLGGLERERKEERDPERVSYREG